MLGASDAILEGKIMRGGMGTGMPYWGPIFTAEQIQVAGRLSVDVSIRSVINQEGDEMSTKASKKVSAARKTALPDLAAADHRARAWR